MPIKWGIAKQINYMNIMKYHYAIRNDIYDEYSETWKDLHEVSRAKKTIYTMTTITKILRNITKKSKVNVSKLQRSSMASKNKYEKIHPPPVCRGSRCKSVYCTLFSDFFYVFINFIDFFSLKILFVIWDDSPKRKAGDSPELQNYNSITLYWMCESSPVH